VANLILVYSDELSRLGLLSAEEIQAVIVKSLEVETASRKFVPRQWLAKRNNDKAGEPLNDQAINCREA
jgi:hypothetical protein